jgi:hypothetical protein
MFNKLRASLSKQGQVRSETFATSPQEEYIPSGLENVVKNTNFMGIQAQNTPQAREIQNSVGKVVGAIQKEVKEFENIRRANEIDEYESKIKGHWLEFERQTFDDPSMDAAAYQKRMEQKATEIDSKIKQDYIDRHGLEKGEYLFNNYMSGRAKGMHAHMFAHLESVRRQKIILEGQVNTADFLKQHNNHLGEVNLMAVYDAKGSDGFIFDQQLTKDRFVSHYQFQAQRDKEFVKRVNLQEELNKIDAAYNQIRLMKGSGIPEIENADGTTSPDYDKIAEHWQKRLKELSKGVIKRSSIHSEVAKPAGKYTKQRWLKRAFDNPHNHIKYKKEDGTTEPATVKTITIQHDIDNDGTMDVLLIPTIREIDGKLQQLDGEEASAIALEKKDYILITGGKNPEENESIGEQLSKEISDGLIIARKNILNKTIEVDGVDIHPTVVEDFVEEMRNKANEKYDENRKFINRTNGRAQYNAYVRIREIKDEHGKISREELHNILYQDGEPIFKGKEGERMAQDLINAALRPDVTFSTAVNDAYVDNMILRNQLHDPHKKFLLDGDPDDEATVAIDESKVGYSLLERENHKNELVAISSKTVNNWYESGSNRTGKKVLREHEAAFNPEFEKLINAYLTKGIPYKADGTGEYTNIKGIHVAQALEKVRMQYYHAYVAKIKSGVTVAELNDITSKHYFFDFNKPPDGVTLPTRKDIQKIKKDGRDALKNKREKTKTKTGAEDITTLGDDAVKRRKPGQTVQEYLDDL